jgi:hypothetical protein
MPTAAASNALPGRQRLLRLVFYGWALVALPLLALVLIEVVLELDPPALAWSVVLGVPALLTACVGGLTRRSVLEISLGAVASSCLVVAVLLAAVLIALAISGETWS